MQDRALLPVRVRAQRCLALLAVASLCLAGQRPASRAAPAAPETLIYGATAQPDTLNPLLTQTVAGQAIDSAVFDSLVRVDNHNHLRPDLATSWQHSADGKTWTFHLRHGVRFADGVTLTSTDVYWTYLSIINPNNQATVTQGWDAVTGMQTPDRFTVVMHLSHWLAPWLGEIGTTPILPKHALYLHPSLLNLPYNRTPFGTGAYRVQSWQTGNAITLVANPYYWGPRPALRTIVYRFFPDDADLLTALQKGRVQMGQVSPDQVPVAQHLSRGRLIEIPSMTWYHVDLKQWGYLRELPVRQALDYATPKDALLRDVLHGHGVIATADVAPSLTPYYTSHVPIHPYDPARATHLLAQDGFRRGPHEILQRCDKHGVCTPLALTLWSVSQDAYSTQANQALARSWRAIGIGVTVRTAPAAQLFGSGGPQFTRAMTGITYGWTNTDDPDDRFYWNSAFIPPNPSAAGGNDVAYFYRFSFQKRIDLLTDSGVLQTNPAKRAPIYHQIQQLLAGQVPVIFLYWQNTITLVPRGLQDFFPSPFTPVFWNVANWHWA